MEARILHILNYGGLGGVQKVVKEISKNNENHFVFCLKKGDFSYFDKKEVFYGAKNFYKFNLFVLIKLIKAIKNKKIDLLHVHTGSGLFYVPFIKFFYPSLKIFFHDHVEAYENVKIYSFLRLIDKFIDKIICVSNFTYSRMRKEMRGHSSKIILLKNFVDNKEMNPSNLIKSNAKNKSKNKTTAGFAARLVERKGWREFLLASENILKNNKTFEFLIAGDGPDRNKLLDVIQTSKFKDKIKYKGAYKNILEFYSQIDIFVISSYWEGLPMAQLECMSVGIPLIIADGPGMNEIGKNKKHVLYFKNKDFLDLSEKIKLLGTNKKLKDKLIKNSLEESIKYSLKIYNNKLNLEYEKILNQKR